MKDLEWTIADLPSIHELEDVLRMAPRRKAKGLDGIPGEMLSAAVPEMGQALYPLVLKSVVKLCQPVQWRGGVLQEAWKQSGSAAEPGNYRSLFISSQIGKCYHRLLRRRCDPIPTAGPT